MIPEILHQTWKSKTGMPGRFAFWRASFLELNPRFEFRLYDDADNRALLARVFPQLLSFYDSFPREIFRVDFIRPVYLYCSGGYYADLDFQCLAPLASIDTGPAGMILGRMGHDESFAHCLPNAFMAGAAGQAFWIGYLAHCVLAWRALHAKRRIANRPEHVTGPVVLRSTVRLYQQERGRFVEMVRQFIRVNSLEVDPDSLSWGELAVLPAHLLYPLNWNDQVHREFLTGAAQADLLHSVEQARQLFPGSAAVTWWAHSWGDAPGF